MRVQRPKASADAAADAQALVTAADTALTAANTALSTAQDHATAAGSAYQAALADLGSAEQALAVAQLVVEGLNEQSEAYADAVADVAAAQQVVDDRQGAVNAAQATVVLSNAAVATAQGNVTSATTTLANAEAAVVAAEDQLALDQAAHATAVTTLANAADALNDAQAVYDFVSNQLLEANADYVAAQRNPDLRPDSRGQHSRDGRRLRRGCHGRPVRRDVRDLGPGHGRDCPHDRSGFDPGRHGGRDGPGQPPDPVGHRDGRQHRPDPERLARRRAVRALQLAGSRCSASSSTTASTWSPRAATARSTSRCQPDDPLYNPASPHTNFMVLTRARGATARHNLTTPWVDQNQTYASHASHQVFLREYIAGPTASRSPPASCSRAQRRPRDLGRHQAAGRRRCSASS